jgi:ADP-heptose:LPS heptosyltransferase
MRLSSRNLFRITRFILLNLPLLFKFFAKFRAPEKRLLIIKTDAIGDYILFRNFLEIVKSCPSYSGYQVHLLGNPLWQQLALPYDDRYVDEFLFIDVEGLYESPVKTLKLAWRLFKKNYDVVLQPTYARTFIIDGLAAFTGAKKIIGFEGDTERIQAKYKNKTDQFYTKLLKLPSNTFFEFDKFIFFFENVLNEHVGINGPYISFEKTTAGGIVIFPGSGVSKRNWGADNFLALSKRILANTSLPIYFAGGEAEIPLCNYLEENLPRQRVYNLAGKTSLIDLIGFIGNAVLVISNETSAVHIASCTKTKSVCLLGGGHFGRFAPYPEHIESKPLCVYEKMDCYNCNWNCRFESNKNDPYPCVSNIAVEKVWEQTLNLLSTT